MSNQEIVLLYQAKLPSYRWAVLCRISRGYNIRIVSSIDEPLALPRELRGIVIQRKTKNIVSNRLYSQSIVDVFRLKPRVIICGSSFGSILFIKLLLLKPFYRYKLILWSHGVRNDLYAKDKGGLRLWTSRALYLYANSGIFYSAQRRKVFVGSNVRLEEKTFVAYNTLETDILSDVRSRCLERSVSEIKSERGIACRWNVAFIGRLTAGKRIDLLVDAVDMMMPKYDIGLIVVGDGPEMLRIRNIADKTNNKVRILGAMSNPYESSHYLHCSDFMVMPGYVGLGIVHGFAFGLPMITCRSTENGPYHSPEIEYLKDGYNGFFCDSTPESIAACIERLILDPELLARMKENALETVRTEANVERMIDGFRQAIDYVTRDDKR